MYVYLTKGDLATSAAAVGVAYWMGKRSPKWLAFSAVAGVAAARLLNHVAETETWFRGQWADTVASYPPSSSA